MKAGASIASLSLLMREESLPEDTHWIGIPAQRAVELVELVNTEELEEQLEGGTRIAGVPVGGSTIVPSPPQPPRAVAVFIQPERESESKSLCLKERPDESRL